MRKCIPGLRRRKCQDPEVRVEWGWVQRRGNCEAIKLAREAGLYQAMSHR